MIQIFDIYNEKIKIYYISQGISLLTVLFFIIWIVFDIKVPNSLYVVLVAIPSLACIFIYAVLTCTGIKKVHIKSGELKISEEFVTIENSIFPVNKINRIKIKASNYLGPFSGDGTGNIIEVYNSTDKKEEVTFFIKSFNQKIELDKILSIWIDQGINVSLNIL